MSGAAMALAQNPFGTDPDPRQIRERPVIRDIAAFGAGDRTRVASSVPGSGNRNGGGK